MKIFDIPKTHFISHRGFTPLAPENSLPSFYYAGLLGQWAIETDVHMTRDGEIVNLTPIEYDILKLLMSHPRQVFSPAEIYEQVWHESPLGFESTVAVHIRHLREKIEITPAEPRYLKVVWGRGYKMEPSC